MQQEFYIVRHTESALNPYPEIINGRSNHIPLSEKGLAQAHELGEYLIDSEILEGGRDAVEYWSSPADRALLTGGIALAAAKIDKPLKVHEGLQEMSHGEKEGMKRKSVFTEEVISRAQREGKYFRLDGGESMTDVAKRGLSAMSEIAKQASAGRKIVIFGHGVFIRCVLGELYDWDYDKVRRTDVPNGSITKFVHSNGQFELEYFAQDQAVKI